MIQTKAVLYELQVLRIMKKMGLGFEKYRATSISKIISYCIYQNRCLSLSESGLEWIRVACYLEDFAG